MRLQPLLLLILAPLLLGVFAMPGIAPGPWSVGTGVAEAQSNRPPRGFARLVIMTNFDEMSVEINGVAYPYERIGDDQYGLLLPSGRWYEIVVAASPEQKRTFRHRLEEGETRILMVDIRNMGQTPQRAAPAARAASPADGPTTPDEPSEDGTQGFLGVSSSPRGVVFVDGTNSGQRTPARRIPVEPGRREIRVQYEASGEMSEPKYVLIRPGVSTNVFFREPRPTE